jgi:metal-responsive CopG/Arc/MetJ family transcriptional regulator
MRNNRKRIQFRAPHRLIDRTDALADVLGRERSEVVVIALREYLQAAAQDESLAQEIETAYETGEISVDQLKLLVGAQRAVTLRESQR